MMRNVLIILRGVYFALFALAVACALWGWNAYRAEYTLALFNGPVALVPVRSPEYYPTLRYRASGAGSVGAPIWEDHVGNMDDLIPSESQPVPRLVKENRDERDAAVSVYEQSDRSPGALQLRMPSVYRERRPARSLQIVCPEDGSIFPPNLCAPFVEWDDPSNNAWMVCVRYGDRERVFISKEKRWRFPKDLWDDLRESAVSDDAQLSVKGVRISENGKREGGVQATPTIRFRISRDPADNFLIYRIVSPPFSTKKTPDLRIRDIRRDEDELFLSSRREYCINCHTFSSKQGNIGKFSVQVRCLNDSPAKLRTYLAVYDFDAKKGKKVQLPFYVQMSTFMSWSPDGSKLAFSANQKLATLYPITYETQLAGSQTADLAIYDDVKQAAYLLPGASDPAMLENYPYWSPDGRTLVFAKTPVGEHPARMRYDLFSIPFKDGEPSVAVPIEGAFSNGRSNVYPRFSPDGKWFTFCQNDGGDLIRSSSDLYIKAGDLQGEARKLECNTAFAADSWYSWSSNSRWIVFTSKRTDGTFSYLYFTHIDEEGRASPGVRLPDETPPLASYNIPEFAAHRPPVIDEELFESLRVEKEPIVIPELKTNAEDAS